MKSRTEECIALGHSGNWKDYTRWFNLYIGVVVTRRNVTPLLILDRIKKLVNRWVNQPRARKHTGGIKCLDCEKNELEWDNEVPGETIDDVDNPIYPTLAAEIPGVVLEADHVDGGDTLDELTLPTNRERAARVG